MKIKKKWLGLLFAAVVFYIIIICFFISMASGAKLIKETGIRTGDRNFSFVCNGTEDLIIGTYEGAIAAYVQNYQSKWRFETKGSIREIKNDSKNQRVFVGSEDRNVYVLEFHSGQQIAKFSVPGRIFSIDISKDGSLIAVSAGVSAIKHALYLYSDDGKLIWKKEIGSTSRKIIFNHDDSMLFLGNDRAEMIAFDIKGNELRKIKLNYQIIDMAYIAQSRTVSAVTLNGMVFLLDETLNIKKKLDFVPVYTKNSARAKSISISDNTDLIAVGTEIGTKQGDIIIADTNNKVLYKDIIDSPVTDIFITGKEILFTGYVDAFYKINRKSLDVAVFSMQINKVLVVLLFVYPILLIFLLVKSFDCLLHKLKVILKAVIKYKTAYLFILPIFALLLLFNYYPVFLAVIRSFTDWNMSQTTLREIKFTGFDNFKLMLSEGYFLIGVKNLVLIMLASFVKVLTVPLLIAKLVFQMKNDRQKYWFRFLFVVPMVVPGIVTMLMWQSMYDPNIGLVNTLLDVLNLDSFKRVWLGDPNTAIWSVIFMGFPFINPFAFLVYYGGLISIPSSLFEAAKVDGSNAWWNFSRIQIPLLSSQFKMLVILTFIGAIQDFGGILILTGGGPGVSTYVPGLEMFYNATLFGRYGYASALGLIMFIVILAGTVINLKIKTESSYND